MLVELRFVFMEIQNPFYLFFVILKRHNLKAKVLSMKNNNLLKTTKEYYDSRDADHFYHQVWGSEDIHIGIYENPHETIFTASKRTVKRMASLLHNIDQDTRILDLGAGYGGAARYLASHFHAHVTCLNLSETENERNVEKNKSLDMAGQIDVIQGNFEAIPFDDNYFDIVWSEEALLHSDDKPKVFEEVTRVLKKGGHFIFTDAMQTDNCAKEELQPILDRIHLQEMGSVSQYRQLAGQNGLQEIAVLEMPDQLRMHYTKVQQELNAQYSNLLKVCSQEYLDRMDKGLSHWIDGGLKGYLNWGILLFLKNE